MTWTSGTHYEPGQVVLLNGERFVIKEPADRMKQDLMNLLYRTCVRPVLMAQLAKHKPTPWYQRFNRKETK